MPRQKREILTGIEIGSSAVKVVMGEFLPDDVLRVVGCGEAPSLKVVKGEIVDASLVQEQLLRAVGAAERAADADVEQIFLAITGSHLGTVTSVGSTVTHADNRVISADDLVTVQRNARAYRLPPDRKVLHYSDRRYMVDGAREVPNPIGLVAQKLESEVQIVFCQLNSFDTVCQMVVDVMGYGPADAAFSGIAAAFGVLSFEEMQQGVLVIDIGAGITEYVVFHGPGLFHAGQVAVGCDHVINDLALGLRLPFPRSRKLLHDLADLGGSAEMSADGRNRLVAVDTVGKSTRHIPMSTVEKLVELRLGELLDIILADLRTHKALSRVGTGIVLTGGGAAIPGLHRLTGRVFGMPVQVGRPRLISGESDIGTSPRYVVPVGLLRWARFSLAVGEAGPGLAEGLRRDMKGLVTMVQRAFKW